MYSITKKADGKYYCEGRIQDGTERWEEDGRDSAIFSMIRFARVMNGGYITESDIRITEEKLAPVYAPAVSAEDLNLLDDIRRGEKIVLPFGDKRLKYRISDEECETILALREGLVKLVKYDS